MARSRKKTELAAQPDPKAPLDSAALLQHAQPVLELLTKDLLQRADGSVAVTRALKARHAQEKAEELTADTYAVWRRGVVVQIAAGWLLSCVFVRTLEDRGLLASNRIAGVGAADAQHTFDQIAPYLTARDYLLAVFRELERYPATKELFDREHNLAWRLAPSAEAVGKLLELFRSPNAEAPAFRFGQADTRFLGDLYQDLSEDVRKRYALLQTPKFVEEFILDRTLDPAIEEFGLEETTLIDPTCGSGHFLLGGFDRLFDRWSGRGLSTVEAVERALESIYGVDVNPYAVSIAKFRMTLSALEKLGTSKVATAPRLPLHVVVGDSLIEGGFAQLPGTKAAAWGDAFGFVDEEAAKAVLRASYTAVVGNPPYITVKDKALRERYRGSYVSAGGKFALSAPFTERFFQLSRSGGFVGEIVADSFAKREFGKNLVTQVLPREDLSLIVDCSGVEVPGHGSTTILLFGRHRAPHRSEVHAILARRGEPATPEDPANGEVWTSIRDHWGEEGFENDYITVEKVGRDKLAMHPWSLEGGGAGELKAVLEERAQERLADKCTIGVFGMTNADDCMLLERQVWTRTSVESEFIRKLAIGEDIRDWSWATELMALYPYRWPSSLVQPGEAPGVFKYLWPYRTVLGNRATFSGGTYFSDGLPWWKWHQVTESRVEGPSITFAFVVSHNHFVLDHGGNVFNRTAPIIKLPDTATEGDHLALLAYLNSSTACFWMKQVCYNKGSAEGVLPEYGAGRIDLRVDRGTTGGGGNYEFAATAIAKCPVPIGLANSPLFDLGRLACEAASAIDRNSAYLAIAESGDDLVSVQKNWIMSQLFSRARLVAIQEEIDWETYRLFGLVDESLVSKDGLNTLNLGQRAFEVALARKYGDGRTPVYGNDGHCYAYEVAEYGPEYRELVERRILAQPTVRQLEAPASKRRWRITDLKAQFEVACDEVFYAGVEGFFVHSEEVARSIGALVADIGANLRLDRIARYRSGNVATQAWLSGVVQSEAVPFLAAWRYRDPGLEKHAAWQQTWDLQRCEDAGESVGEIPVPPKYAQTDYRSPTYWPLRGKLDVPKERFISYPGCESDRDNEPIYGWAGWDHAQRAKALATLYVDRKDNEAWSRERLQPMLAGLLELLPWVHQWHPEPDPDTGEPFGAFLETWLEGECQRLGFTHDDLRAWRPTKKAATKKAPTKKASAKKAST